MILTERQQKYQHCHLVKSINEYLTGEENDVQKNKQAAEINRNDLVYKSSKCKYDFRRYKKQSDLLGVILNFNNKVRSRSKADKDKNIYTLKKQMLFIKVENLLLIVLKAEYFH